MDDLIDREELLNSRPEYRNPQMEDEIKSARHQGWNDCNSYYYSIITEQPTVDTERHAHWEYVKPLIRKCSKCGYLSSDVLYSNCFNYCPNCGCKMDDKAYELMYLADRGGSKCMNCREIYRAKKSARDKIIETIEKMSEGAENV